MGLVAVTLRKQRISMLCVCVCARARMCACVRTERLYLKGTEGTYTDGLEGCIYECAPIQGESVGECVGKLPGETRSLSGFGVDRTHQTVDGS